VSGVLGLPATRVWLVLVALTVVSFVVAEHAASARIAATAAISIAAFKVRLVVDHFMELEWRPLPWRILFECWTVASALLLIGGLWS
jgi:hypothetical protein